MLFGGLRGALTTLGVLLGVYALIVAVAVHRDTFFARLYYVLDRTTWHNATARPPVILVIVVTGWSFVVTRCRNSGIKLELVLGPGSLLPARATFRAAVILLNLVLLAHLGHFVADAEHATAPWYLVCDVLLHLAIVALFLSPPAMASAIGARPSDANLNALGVGSASSDSDAALSSSSSSSGGVSGVAIHDSLLGGSSSDLEDDGAAVVRGLGLPHPGTPTSGAVSSSSASTSGKVLSHLSSHASSSAGLLYPDARAGLARAVRESLSAPFAPVTFWHVIVADYATSLAKALGDLQITTCVAASAVFSADDLAAQYSPGWGAPVFPGATTTGAGRRPRGHHADFLGGASSHTPLMSSSETWDEALFERFKKPCASSYANAFMLGLPYYCRLGQCLRVYSETRERKNLVNALKYCSAFPLVAAGFAQKRTDPSDPVAMARARTLLVAAAVVNSSFSFGWDVVMDWGLLKPKRRAIVLGRLPHLWLVLTYASLLAFNLCMRFAWALAVFSHISAYGAGMFALEAAEVLRRTVWAIFRIEWEYVNHGYPIVSQRDIRKAVHMSVKHKAKGGLDDDDVSGVGSGLANADADDATPSAKLGKQDPQALEPLVQRGAALDSSHSPA